jgi:hypothetical protein
MSFQNGVFVGNNNGLNWNPNGSNNNNNNNNNNNYLHRINTSLFEPPPNINLIQDASLFDLITWGALIIADYEITGNVNYDELSDVLHDLTTHPGIDEHVDNPEVRYVIDSLRDIQAGTFGVIPNIPAGVVGVIPNIPADANDVIPNITYGVIPNRGRISVPKNAINTVTLNSIVNGDQMINFQGEKNYGRFYKRNTFNRIPNNNIQGLKKNPTTRALIQPGPNLYTYTANVSGNLNENLGKINTTLFTEGGKARKSRRAKKSKKTRKNRKH